jgi:hypothetical protein
VLQLQLLLLLQVLLLAAARRPVLQALLNWLEACALLRLLLLQLLCPPGQL